MVSQGLCNSGCFVLGADLESDRISMDQSLGPVNSQFLGPGGEAPGKMRNV